MATFELTARMHMSIGGNRINQGDRFQINIFQPGINPNTLFGDPRCKGNLLQQLSSQGLNIPPDSHYLRRVWWDVKMLK